MSNDDREIQEAIARILGYQTRPVSGPREAEPLASIRPKDDRRPRILRTNSVFAGARATGAIQLSSRGVVERKTRGEWRTGAANAHPVTDGTGTRWDKQGQKAREALKAGEWYRGVLDKLSNDTALARRITGDSQTLDGVTVIGGRENATESQLRQAAQNAEAQAIFGPLNLSGITGQEQFIFDNGAPLGDLATGERRGSLESRGVFGSADSLERQLPEGETIRSGDNQNWMTVAGGVKWLRALASRDKAAYNKLVVQLRNAGYLNGQDHDLPLGGYSTQVGIAFAQAANDLSQANDGGDERTLMEYLTERGEGLAEYLAQEEADRLKAEEYQPVNRNYTDPTTIEAAARDAARQAIGRKLTDEEEARLTAAIRAKEDAFYDQVDEAGRAETSYSLAQPDPSGQIDAFIQDDEFLDERQTVMAGEYATEFMRMMGVG